MSKTYMVAQREFVENMRTKTFWIGVLAAPVGIILVYGLMFLLAGKTDLRRYAILDKTENQWFSSAVHEERSENEFGEILGLVNASEADQKAFAERLQASIEKLAEDHPIRRLIRDFENQGLLEDLAKVDGDRSKLPAAVRAKLLKITTAWGLKLMMDEKDRNLALQFAGGLSVKDYIDIQFEAVGEDPEQELNKMLRDDKIFAYFVVEDPFGDKKSKYVSNNFTDSKLRNHYSKHATAVIRSRHVERLRQEKDLSRQDIADINAGFRIDKKQISASGEEKEVEIKDASRSFAPLVFVYALWIAVVMMTQMLLTNTVEEKSNRIIEVLLSSVSPSELMNGKIFGIAFTGFTILGSWSLFLIAGIKLAPKLLPGQAASQFGALGLDQIVQDPLYLASFLGYFIAGYLFYAAVLVAIGSVCSSLKESQNLQQPVMFALFVPFVTMFPIMQDPNGTLAKVITYIPLYTPFAMMNRAGGPPPAWEYVASTALIVVSIWLAFRGAAKVFRVGVLMTGKPPKIREILKWMRTPTR
ncbi:MAG: ABC transporter permease [Planctomycetota bacterium]|nr:ABC transporter permease [Planctomycetota bacterium]